jgi:predicted RNA-binding Zn-ribbon protein involved in translation (DUF1610 family)
MPISFQCPQCGKKLKAPDEAAGKSSKCPGCGGAVTCPEPIYDAEVLDASEKPSSAHDPYADLDDDKPYGVVNPQPGEDPAGESRRPCPMCGEMILANAAKCRYCGEVFDPALKKVKGGKSNKKYGPGDEDLTTGDKVVAVLCSGIGCIAGLVWMIQGKPKGKKMLGLSIAMNVVWFVVRVILELVAQQLNNNRGGP